MRRLLTALLAWMLFFVPSALAEEVEITIFHTNDVHARATQDVGMGYAMAAGFVDAARSAGEHVLLLDAGDAFHGQAIASVSKGRSIVAFMNAMGYDALAVGSHDFNYGLDVLLELERLAEFPLLSCGIRTEQGDLLLSPYVIQEIAGKKIGIIGVQGPDVAESLDPALLEHLIFEEGILSVSNAVAEIRDETDAIIVLAYWDQDQEGSDALARIPGVDLVIEGGRHRALETGRRVGDALVVSAGEYLKHLGRVRMFFGGEALRLTAELIPAPEIYPSATLQNAILQAEIEQKKLLEETLVTCDILWLGEREQVRTQETNLGNLIADAVRAMTRADIALIQGGSIRKSLEPGEVSRGDVMAILPFSTYTVVKSLTGAAIKEALEHAVAQYPEQNSGFMQVSGLSFRFDPTLPVGFRVVELLINGEHYQDNHEYTVALSDTIASGSLGYGMFADVPVLHQFGGAEELLAEYLSEEEEVPPVTDGRIIVVK